MHSSFNYTNQEAREAKEAADFESLRDTLDAEEMKKVERVREVMNELAKEGIKMNSYIYLKSDKCMNIDGNTTLTISNLHNFSRYEKGKITIDSVRESCRDNYLGILELGRKVSYFSGPNAFPMAAIDTYDFSNLFIDALNWTQGQEPAIYQNIEKYIK